MKKAAHEAACAKFIAEHAEIATAFVTMNEATHANNSFARDIRAKFFQYASISARQIETLLASLERDRLFAARRAEQDAAKATLPTLAPGRYEVTGTVLSTRAVEQEGFGYGSATLSYKMLLQREDGNRLWLTVLSALFCDGVTLETMKSRRVKLTATWEVSDKDEHFGFGKRPSKAQWVPTGVEGITITARSRSRA